MRPDPLDQSFFERDVETVASDLIGVSIFINGVGGRIVETEAYGPLDPAAHTFRGPTLRNAAMFGPSGNAYIYRIYGLHWCMNVTCGHGAGVLLRAIEPHIGIDDMRARRGLTDPRLLCSGPGRLCQALGIDLDFNRLPLNREPFNLRPRKTKPTIIACPRIGISVATDTLWRFCEKDSRYLSKPIGPWQPGPAGVSPDVDKS